MNSRNAVLVLLLSLLCSSSLLADASDFYIIPVSGHTPGLNGTFWMSDLAINNFSDASLSVQAVLIQSGENSAENVLPLAINGNTVTGAIPPGGTVLLRDLLNGFGGMPSVSGAILIGADRPFAVTSRTYSTNPGGHTIGQTVTPARDFLDNSIGVTDHANAVAYVTGLTANARYRTNLGFVAGNANPAGGEPLVIDVAVTDGNGVTMGTRRFTIPAATFSHVQFSSQSFVNAPFDVATASFRIVSGSGAVVPYASVVDNGTADAAFVLGEFPQNRAAGKAAVNGVFRSLFNSVVHQ